MQSTLSMSYLLTNIVTFSVIWTRYYWRVFFTEMIEHWHIVNEFGDIFLLFVDIKKLILKSQIENFFPPRWKLKLLHLKRKISNIWIFSMAHQNIHNFWISEISDRQLLDGCNVLSQNWSRKNLNAILPWFEWCA